MIAEALHLAVAGTEDGAIGTLHQAQQSGRETMHLGAKTRKETEQVAATKRVTKTVENAGENGILRASATHNEEAGPLGFEPRLTDPESVVLGVFSAKNVGSADRAALCAAAGAPTEHVDPELQFVIARWRELPAAVRAGILAMVRVSTEQMSE